MPTCSAPGCRSGYACEENTRGRRHFFKPPYDPAALKAWTAAIPRKAFRVTVKTYICDLHFESEDLITCYEHIVDGNVVKIPREVADDAPSPIPKRQQRRRCAGYERGPLLAAATARAYPTDSI
ncbi:hypothetical protein HPB50_022144 [Hyalomma asiaticum]|uniref:Uncharacterized protein n=1 Tax=Hyalomma asiaticum TaxID=266040 RepID=A0ACB7TDM1_HYAAI|nr:hypothetical protein HPB50_022144 [Hyalomma asiaticum]